jgi:hypothetical protein
MCHGSRGRGRPSFVGRSTLKTHVSVQVRRLEADLGESGRMSVTIEWEAALDR